MTQNEIPTHPPAVSGPVLQPKPRRIRRYLAIAAVALTAGLAGAAGSQALSQGFGPGHWGGGPGMMGPGFGGPMGLDPARAEEHADRMVRHLAIEIDATAEQQVKLRAIVKAAVKDLIPLREKARTARQQAGQLLTQPTIDRAAIEKFRAERVAEMDAVSKRLTQALADASEVLTPEQRQKVAEQMANRERHWRGWRHRG
jgi:Spy/CpxP family protein refolding chaperone